MPVRSPGGARLVEQLKGGLDAPICLTWEITYGCNLACIHCLSSSGAATPRELSTAEARAVIDELHDLQVFYVNIGGGEPTIRADFYDLVDYAVAQGVGVKFSTNGSTITPDRARRLSGTDYVDVQISIDGADAATNDAVRGRGFVRRGPAGDGPSGRGRFGPFKISVVVTRHNAGQLDALEQLAAATAPNCGSPGCVLRAAVPTPGASCIPTAEQQVALYHWLVERPGVLTGDSFFHLSALGEPLPGLNLCGAGRVVCLIDPVGDVYACPFVLHPEFRAGSVRQPGGFSEVWRHSDLFLELRQPAVRWGVRLVWVLRRLPGRLHGGQVLYRTAPRRARPRVRQGTWGGPTAPGPAGAGALTRAGAFRPGAAAFASVREPRQPVLA